MKFTVYRRKAGTVRAEHHAHWFRYVTRSVRDHHVITYGRGFLSREEAQRELDRRAKRHGWEVRDENSNCGA